MVSAAKLPRILRAQSSLLKGDGSWYLLSDRNHGIYIIHLRTRLNIEIIKILKQIIQDSYPAPPTKKKLVSQGSLREKSVKYLKAFQEVAAKVEAENDIAGIIMSKSRLLQRTH